METFYFPYRWRPVYQPCLLHHTYHTAALAMNTSSTSTKDFAFPGPREAVRGLALTPSSELSLPSTSQANFPPTPPQQARLGRHTSISN